MPHRLVIAFGSAMSQLSGGKWAIFAGQLSI
jgi:hypothetical protein